MKNKYTSVKVISFLFPIIGLIIYAVNVGRNDELAKISLKWVIRSFIIIGILVVLYIISIIVVSLIINSNFKKTNVKNIMIPDVSGQTITNATKMLEDSGFIVNNDYIYINDKNFENGCVIKTKPEIGSKRKSGTTITLYISKDSTTYIMSDYTGENYLTAKSKIEQICNCNVVIESEISSDSSKENVVLRTEPQAGQTASVGNVVKIIIPEVEYKYPNFTNGYSIDDIKAFASKHELKLIIEYEENNNKEDGTIIKQSRSKDTIVIPGATLIITIVNNK